MEIRRIEVIENNKIKQYDVLFTVKDEINNKEFVIYTDLNSNIDIYAALYDEKEKKLDFIDNPQDQKMIEDIIKFVKENSINGEVLE